MGILFSAVVCAVKLNCAKRYHQSHSMFSQQIMPESVEVALLFSHPPTWDILITHLAIQLIWLFSLVSVLVWNNEQHFAALENLIILKYTSTFATDSVKCSSVVYQVLQHVIINHLLVLHFSTDLVQQNYIQSCWSSSVLLTTGLHLMKKIVQRWILWWGCFVRCCFKSQYCIISLKFQVKTDLCLRCFKLWTKALFVHLLFCHSLWFTAY